MYEFRLEFSFEGRWQVSSGLSYSIFSNFFFAQRQALLHAPALQIHLSSTTGLSREGEGCNKLWHFVNFGIFIA